MGQSFNFLNIDKRQQLCIMSEYGELFRYNFPAVMIKFLAVPKPQDYETEGIELLTWAGDRIICIGEYANDWPDSILAADDANSLESPRFLYHHAFNVLCSPHLNMLRSPNYSGHGVLRNLNKKIYVRSDGIPAFSVNGVHAFSTHQEPSVSPVYHSPGLGCILMSKIGWSTDSRMDMRWDNAASLSEGEWAGDRFDVRPYDEVKEELESGGWIDATEEEVERLVQILKPEGLQPQGLKLKSKMIK